jgi:hypothetical protein
MRAKISFVILLSTLSASATFADQKGKEASPSFSLPPADAPAEPSKFSGAHLAFVQSWIRQKAPECPTDISEAVAEQFLEELQQRSPEKLDKLTTANFPLADFESTLLRQVAAKLTGATHTAAREEIARRRVGAMLAASGRDAPEAAKEASGLIEKIRDGSAAQYRRLVDGRIDDDDLQILLRKASQVGTAKKEPEPAKPKLLTASDIVTEFSRRNQTGSALQRLQAYVVEGRIKTANGEEQELLLFRMKPDCFKLVVRSAGVTRYILAGSGGRFWQHAPGKSPETVPLQALGQRKYLNEFADPLFSMDDYVFERLDDGTADGKKFYRVAVRRPDGSNYVARIDTETFREVGRENEDRSIARYSDFRDVAGVIYSFREDLTDVAGRPGMFELTRISPNPGLIRDFFEPAVRPDLGYYELEGYLAPAQSTAMKFN